MQKNKSQSTNFYCYIHSDSEFPSKTKDNLPAQLKAIELALQKEYAPYLKEICVYETARRDVFTIVVEFHCRTPLQLQAANSKAESLMVATHVRNNNETLLTLDESAAGLLQTHANIFTVVPDIFKLIYGNADELNKYILSNPGQLNLTRMIQSGKTSSDSSQHNTPLTEQLRAFIDQTRDHIVFLSFVVAKRQNEITYSFCKRVHELLREVRECSKTMLFSVHKVNDEVFGVLQWNTKNPPVRNTQKYQGKIGEIIKEMLNRFVENEGLALGISFKSCLDLCALDEQIENSDFFLQLYPCQQMEAFNDGIGTQEIYDALAECSSVGTDIAIKSIAVTTMTKRTLTFEECVSFEADLKAKRKDIIGMRVYRSSNNNNVQCICVDSTENLS